ncbi:Pleckstrin homology domain-containing protein [Strongyloides ratti]|uniref:Pleckstrin homology domain-containing protein n=1 Tax=Strongyloides ratti TaxID=34506 RepID=A0A090KRK8_STRRB|nr:Pleckstrin homology domain-containing protein [Strongyloides ratti]CEF60129.1 Pleckstrin homology domain-containing protein [Strongyloides ratti]
MPTRQIIKEGCLQTKLIKYKGALMFKKKKILYEKENCWVVLCKHDDKIPLLEWYPSSLAVENHKPAQVADLLNVSYITQTVGEDRAFIIGFDDPQREPLELVSLSLDECNFWIEQIRETLSSLNCLSQTLENMYTIIPEDNSSQNGVEDNNKRSSSEYPNNFQSNNDNTSTLSCSSNSKNEIMPFSKELGKEEEKDRKILIESPLSKNINSLSKNEVTNKNDYEEMKEINGSYSNLQQPLILVVPEVEAPHITNNRSLTSMSSSSSTPNINNSNLLDKSSPTNKITNSSSPEINNKKMHNNYRHGIRSKNNKLNIPKSPIPNLPPRNFDDNDFNDISSNNLLIKNMIKEENICKNFNPPSPEPISYTSNLIYDKLYKPFKQSAPSTTSSDNDTCSSLADSIASMTLNNLLPLKTGRYKTNLNEVHSTDFYDTLPVLLNVPQSLTTSDTIYDTLPIDSADLLNEHRVRNLSLVYTVIAEHIVFVEISGRVFVGGWTIQMHPKLIGLIHVGDEIIECDNKIIKDLEHFHNILCQHDLSGNPISLRIRSIPFGKVFFIKKIPKTSPEELLGLILKRKKNVIVNDNREIFLKSENCTNENNINSKNEMIYETLTTQDSTSPVITELNDKPTNMFATSDDHLYRRIDKLPKNSHFSIIIHPRDFSRLIKANIKQSLTFIRFIHDQ